MQGAVRWSVVTRMWNDAASVSDLFSSLDQARDVEVQPVLILHAAIASSGEQLRAQRPDLVLLRHTREQGIAAAYNQAIGLALSRWPKEVLNDRFIAFVHPGTILEPQCLSSLQHAFEDQLTLMVAGPKLLEARVQRSDMEQRDVEFLETLSSAGNIWRGGNLVDRGVGVVDAGQYDADVSQVLPSTDCFMVRASLFAQGTSQWFDEHLSGDAAITDFLWRVQRFGVGFAWRPEAAAWVLKRGEGLDKMSFFAYKRWTGRDALLWRRAQLSAGLVQWKNAPGSTLFLRFILLPFALLKWTGLSLLNPGLFPSLIRAIASFPRMIVKRFDRSNLFFA